MIERYDVIIVGAGVAGLSAALASIERVLELSKCDARIALLERASREDRGGNTRYSTATLRMKDRHTINDDFVAQLRMRTDASDEYIEFLAEQAPDAVQWAERHGLDFAPMRRLFLTSSDPRTQPAGAGAAIVQEFFSRVEAASRGRFFGPGNELALSVEVLYETTATDLLRNEEGAVTGVVTRNRSGKLSRLGAPAVVLASGGFEGNSEMMTRYVGFDLPTVSRGGAFNRGEGIQMALNAGAKATGQWNQFHPLPADPRTAQPASGLMTFAAVMETVPYGILVNRSGKRFMDEGATSMDYLYDIVGRAVQQQPGQIAYVLFDSKTMDLPQYQTAVSKDKVVDPIQAGTMRDLASLIGVDADSLRGTVDSFNNSVAAEDSNFDQTALDGLSTTGLTPPKSNWARAIDSPPFYCYPVTCANVFSMGGIGTDHAARVIDSDGVPIPGLFAAGEMTGIYHNDYVGATSVLRGLVFGRAAGYHAVDLALNGAGE
jgi:tricarballylate dehydrogenase